MEDNNLNWLISIAYSMEILQSTKLSFLKYSDLVSMNDLSDAFNTIENKTVKGYGIEQWAAYTAEVLELNATKFGEFFFAGIDPDEEVLLITDPGQMKEVMFRFSVKELFSFANWYERYMKYEFYDFSQYTVIFPNLNTIRFYHDNGVIVEYAVL